MARILLVEDEAHLADGIRFNLELEGHDVETIGDGLAAVARVAPEETVPVSPGPDLVVLDVMLPGLDGFQIVRRMRQTGNFGANTSQSDNAQYLTFKLRGEVPFLIYSLVHLAVEMGDALGAAEYESHSMCRHLPVRCSLDLVNQGGKINIIHQADHSLFIICPRSYTVFLFAHFIIIWRVSACYYSIGFYLVGSADILYESLL